MHEAALARTITAALGTRPAAEPDGVLRVLVHGGHDDPGSFDESLRLHLALSPLALQSDRIEIVHEPAERLCSGCGHAFRAVEAMDPCPSCGSPGLPRSTADDVEEIELEWASNLGRAERH